MAELFSVNYIKPLMCEIYNAIEKYPDKKIIWFGEVGYISLIYDYLAADGMYILCIADNDSNKWGKIIERNWCMPLFFNYVELQKNEVDNILFGHDVPELKIMSPDEVINKYGDINDMLFFTCSYRAEEIKKQLTDMGADERNVVILPNTNYLIESAMNQMNEYIGEKIKIEKEEHRRIVLELLDEFTGFCNKHGLKYYLSYGTLIGAVRHKGFIPWDDDADIIMPIDDYLYFFDNYMSDSRFEVLNYSVCDDYFFPFGKLVKNDTYLIHDGIPTIWTQGIYIDIIPFSGVDDTCGATTLWKKHSLLEIKWYWYMVTKDIIRNKLPDCRDDIFNKHFEVDMEDTTLVGVPLIGPAKPWSIHKKAFQDSYSLEFEGRNYNAPSGYDEYLRSVYGDYMQIPPKEKQRVHGFPVYKKS